MLTETGRVVAVDADGVWVETIRQSTCGSCAAQKGCGHGLMNRISDGHRSLIRALPGRLSAGDCQVDDQVRISMPEDGPQVVPASRAAGAAAAGPLSGYALVPRWRGAAGGF